MLAAPAIVHYGNLMPVKTMIWQGIPIHNWDGAILHNPTEQLRRYTMDIMREHIRTNLFSPYMDQDIYLDPNGDTKRRYIAPLIV